MLRKKNVAAFVVTLLAFSSNLILIAQDSVQVQQPSFKISGSIDGYYKYDFAKTSGNSLTSFTQTHNHFALGMASIKFEHKSNKINAVADLGFGSRAKDFTYTDQGITQAIKQMYISYTPVSWLTLTMGTWATHIGYELLDPQMNRNYSMSYLFSFGPFSHTGMKAAITKGKHNFMLGVANASDYRIPPSDMINKKFILAQYSMAINEKTNLYLNFVSGQSPDTSKSKQADAVITTKINDFFSMGFNGTYTSVATWENSNKFEQAAWWGSALYLNFDPSKKLGITLRSELFSDKKQLKIFKNTQTGGSVFATTLSASLKNGGLIFVPEFRFEHSNKILFINKNGTEAKSAANILLAVIYSF